MKTVGEKIRIRRKELGWSMRELADKMGYSNQSTISRIENNTQDISQSKLAEFASVLNVSVAYLMDWENDSISDIVVRLRQDYEFTALVKNLDMLSSEQLASVKQIVDVLLKRK